MRCLHHVDADGYGAAAIVRYELTDPFDTVLPEHFVEYDHSGTITVDEGKFFNTGKPGYLYIVDLAIDQVIFEFIKKCVDHGMMIVHIDHHVSGINFLEQMSDEDRSWYKEHVNYFFNNEYSGCMLTWLYACMIDTERARAMTVPFDFTEDFSQVAINPDTDNIRIHGIPLAIRMIDDNDVWRHALPESKFFAAAWGIQDDKSPLNMEFWSELLYEGPKKAYDMIDDGEKIFKFMENQSKSVMKNAFEVTIGKYKGIAVNCPFGNSRLFGDAYEKYDFVIKYFQTSSDRLKWRYTIYSREGGADCEELVKKYFDEVGLCGGHKHAAAGTITKNIFDKTRSIN
jgi:oligoribonuclease NrnB/cAMP/cGMP phosphodiesterase (DHH superfamily)